MRRPFITIKECKPWLTWGKTTEITKYSEILGDTLNTGGDLHYRVKNQGLDNIRKTDNDRRLRNAKRRALRDTVSLNMRSLGNDNG